MVSGIMLIRFPQRFGLKFNWTALYRFCNLRETIFSYSAGQRVGETANNPAARLGQELQFLRWRLVHRY
jgi:hypothetical protein